MCPNLKSWLLLLIFIAIVIAQGRVKHIPEVYKGKAKPIEQASERASEREREREMTAGAEGIEEDAWQEKLFCNGLRWKNYVGF